MKAGIFKRKDNDKHIYVRKDRSIGAIELTDVHPCDSEYKVSERVGGKYVNVPDSNGEYFVTVAERVADAPKGANDCVKALGDYVDSLKAQAQAHQGEMDNAEARGGFGDEWTPKAQAEIEQPSRKPRRVPVVVPPVRLVAQNDAAVAEQDPELAAYHGEADESDREAVNLLPDDVSPAQSLHDFVAERLQRIDSGGEAPPVVVVDTPEKVEKTVAETLMRKEETRDKVMRGCSSMFDLVEKPTDISADGFREIRAMQEELKADVIRKMTVPAELGMPYGAGKSGPTPVSEYAANMFARLDAQREIERVANGSADENGFDIGGALSATGTITVGLKISDAMMQHLQQTIQAGKDMHRQLVHDVLTDRVELQPGVSDEVLWHNDEERERLARERLARGEFRLCHAAAARKHKKKRDRHVWWHPVFGCYAWKKVEVAA